jgi:hypothetical protein
MEEGALVTKEDRNRAEEELLLHAADRDWDPEGPELGAAYGDDRQGLERARDWLRTRRAYTELAAGERELVQSVMRSEPTEKDAHDREKVRAFFQSRTLQRPQRPARVLRLSFPAWQMAAGLLVLIGAAVWVAGAGWEVARDDPLLLGNKGISDLEPSGPVRTFGEFRWSVFDLPPGGSYRLVVESAGSEILRIEGLSKASYTPTPDELAALDRCDEIAWRVYALTADARAAPLASGSASSSRR